MKKPNKKQTSIRATAATVDQLRLVGHELSIATQKPLMSDDQRIRALIDHYRNTQTTLEVAHT